MKTLRFLHLLPVVLTLAFVKCNAAQMSLPQGCKTATAPASDADTALYLEDWAKAEHLYQVQLEKDPASLQSQAGLIRVMLGKGRIDEALKDATAMGRQHEGSTEAQTVLAETYLRRGELASAAPILSKALSQDSCYARAHLQEARLQSLSGFHASAARQLEQAHSLDPNDDQITVAWMFSLPPKERFAKLKDFVSIARFLTESDREDLRSNILEGEARMNSSCTVSAPEGNISIPFWVTPTLSHDPSSPTIDVTVNGKAHRMFFSTDHGGITISFALAHAMGLTPVAKFSYSQLYNGGRIHYYLANLSSIRVGAVEYKNCLVTVVDEIPGPDVGKVAAVTNPAGADGSISAGFFADFLVGIDTPKRVITLSTLPPATPQLDSRGISSWSDVVLSKGNPVPSINGGIWGQYNRTMPAHMKDWEPTIDYRHNLWIPTHIGGGPAELFLLELSYPWPRISTTAVSQAAKIETLTHGKNVPFKGYFLEFAGRFVPINSWTSVRFDEFSKHIYLETAGTIGGEALRQLNMTIDYRDNLVQFTH